MTKQKERAVAPTTAPKKNTAKKSYQESANWSTESQLHLGELLLLSTFGEYSEKEQVAGYRVIERILRYRIDLGLFREVDLNVKCS